MKKAHDNNETASGTAVLETLTPSGSGQYHLKIVLRPVTRPRPVSSTTTPPSPCKEETRHVTVVQLLFYLCLCICARCVSPWEKLGFLVSAELHRSLPAPKLSHEWTYPSVSVGVGGRTFTEICCYSFNVKKLR